MYKLKQFLCETAPLVLVVIILLAMWIGYSYIEAQRYNALTNSRVTVIDAMFLELRVDSRYAPIENR
jgi:predicted negative regulator of RcsB-dependent stress response